MGRVDHGVPGRSEAARLIGSGPRAPNPDAHYTYVTTQEFLIRFGLESLQDLPEWEKLQEVGLLSKQEAITRIGNAPPPAADGRIEYAATAALEGEVATADPARKDEE
jgi:hypothetical protein